MNDDQFHLQGNLRAISLCLNELLRKLPDDERHRIATNIASAAEREISDALGSVVGDAWIDGLIEAGKWIGVAIRRPGDQP